MNRLALMVVSGMLLSAAVAYGGVVRVITGPNSHGQGWMFLDSDGVCKVATAGHVVKLADGRVVSHIQITDTRGSTLTLGAPEILSEDPDIAVLPVNGGNALATCDDGRLSGIGVARRIKVTERAKIETTGETETIEVPVRWRASLEDAKAGSIFSVQPTNPSDRIIKGWSGSAIVDDEGLLGIVIEVDEEHNEAIGVRADIIRGLLDGERMKPGGATKTGSALVAPIIQLVGSTPDPDYGSERIYEVSAGGWKVVPSQGKVVFVIGYENPIHLRGIGLNFSTIGNTVSGVDVSVSPLANSGTWTSLNYCRTSPESVSVRCPVVGSIVRSVRISVKMLNDEPLTLSGLEVLHQ